MPSKSNERPSVLDDPAVYLVGLTDISRTYLPLVRASLDAAAEGVFIPSGRPIAFILNCIPDGLLLRPVPRRQVAELIPKIYRSEGIQLELPLAASSSMELPEPPLTKASSPVLRVVSIWAAS